MSESKRKLFYISRKRIRLARVNLLLKFKLRLRLRSVENLKVSGKQGWLSYFGDVYSFFRRQGGRGWGIPQTDVSDSLAFVGSRSRAKFSWVRYKTSGRQLKTPIFGSTSPANFFYKPHSVLYYSRALSLFLFHETLISKFLYFSSSAFTRFVQFAAVGIILASLLFYLTTFFLVDQAVTYSWGFFVFDIFFNIELLRDLCSTLQVYFDFLFMQVHLIKLDAAPLSVSFNKTGLSLKTIFYAPETVYSYYELFSLFTYSNFVDARVYYFIISLFLSVIFLLSIYYFLVYGVLRRWDTWGFFVNFSYDAAWASRIRSLDGLHQLTNDKLLNLSRDVDFLRGSAPGIRLSEFQTFCFEYHYAQTVGGTVGFLDLFPTRDTVYNPTQLLKARLKTFVFFRKFRSYLRKKIKVIRSNYAAKVLKKKSVGNLKSSVYVVPNVLSDFTAFRVYLEAETSVFLNFFDWIRNISRLGDYGVLRLRWHFVNRAVLGRDPWVELDEEEDRVFPEVQSRSTLQKINWYGRELNSVVSSRTLFGQFNPKALTKFKLKRHNSVNDYSFWKTEDNAMGDNVYFSAWDTFPVENQFDLGVLGDSKFDNFERLKAAAEDEDDELHPEYTSETEEIYFEDGLLHKDFELIFFDHEFDDKVVVGRFDDLLGELEENEKLVAVVLNESLIYKAGQEGDHLVKTTSADYSREYSLEYGDSEHYKHGVGHTIYEDLSDFLVLGSSQVIPRIFGIPRARSFFYWESKNKFESFRILERHRLGRFTYFYWQTISDFLVLAYHKRWLAEYFVLPVALPTWFIVIIFLTNLLLVLYLPELYVMLDWVLGLFCLVFTCALIVFFAPLLNYIVISDLSFRMFFVMIVGRYFNVLATALLLVFANIYANKVSREITSGFTVLSPSKNLSNFSLKDLTVFEFFFKSAAPFVALNVPLGLSDAAVRQKIIKGGSLANPILHLKYTTPLFFSRSGNCGFSIRGNSQISKFYFKDLLAFNGHTNNFSFVTTLVYDFNFIHLAQTSPNFLYGINFQEIHRYTKKAKLLSKTPSLLTEYTSGTFLRKLRPFGLKSEVAWSGFLDDVIFNSLPRFAELPINSERFALTGHSKSQLKLDLPRRALNRSWVNSRSRFKSLGFFEVRPKHFSNTLTITAYENFLRLFFSEETLDMSYRLRSERLSAAIPDWSYLSKVRFATYATPLHDVSKFKKKL